MGNDVLLGPTTTGCNLEDLLLPGPLSGVSAVLLILSLWGWGQWLSQRLIGHRHISAVEESAGFVLATAILSALVHTVGLAGWIHFPTLRLLGAALAVPGCALAMRGFPSRARALGTALQRSWSRGSRLDRAAIACSLGIVIALGLVAIAPPTDSDSLHYHLGVPLQWFRAGSIRPTPFWLHSRLTGLGEALILFGLAMGTDCLGSVLNWVGLVFIVVAVAAWMPNSRVRPAAILLVTAPPILTFLVSTQKTQLYPIAAILSAIVVFRSRRRSLSTGTFWLAFASIAFAIACKHSFLFSAMPATTIGLIEAKRRGMLGRSVALLVLAVALFPLPLFVRNYVFYGDPISPLLERLRTDHDPVVLAFAGYLRNFAGDHTFKNLAKLPILFVIPTSLRRLNGALGVGVLAILLVRGGRRTDWTMLRATFLLTGVLLIFGQWSSRFFLEPYLWMSIAVSRDLRKSPARLFQMGLLMQGILTLAISLRGVWTLTPGVMDAGHREATLNAVAIDFSLLKALDKVLPADAIVTGMSPNHTNVPRPFLASDYFRMLEATKLSDSEKRRRIKEIFDRSGVNSFVIYTPDVVDPFGRLVGSETRVLGSLPKTTRSSRNPFAAESAVDVKIYRYRPSRQGPVREDKEDLGPR